MFVTISISSYSMLIYSSIFQIDRATREKLGNESETRRFISLLCGYSMLNMTTFQIRSLLRKQASKH